MVSGLDVVLDYGIENSDPTTEKRSRSGDVDALRQWNDPAFVRSYLIGKAAVTANDYSLSGGTQIVISRHALATSHTRLGKPTEANCLPWLEMRDPFTHCANFSYDFMTRHEGVFSHFPVVVQHAQVAMTNAARADVNFNLVSRKLPRIVFKGFQMSSSCLCCIRFCRHFLLPSFYPSFSIVTK